MLLFHTMFVIHYDLRAAAAAATTTTTTTGGLILPR